MTTHLIISYIYVKAAVDIDILLQHQLIKQSSQALQKLKKRKKWLAVATVSVGVLCFLPEYALISYFLNTKEFKEWYVWTFTSWLWDFLMILLLAVWSTALAIVYIKIKATGQTAPNKAIFITHFVLASAYILS